jgi:hypothetical protein
MVQQDNKPNNETTVDGKPLFKGQPNPQQNRPETPPAAPKSHEYPLEKYQRDDDPLLSESERENTRGDILHKSPGEVSDGPSHPE